MQPVNSRYLPKIAMYLIKNFNPPYSLNDLEKMNHTHLSSSMNIAQIIMFCGILGKPLRGSSSKQSQI